MKSKFSITRIESLASIPKLEYEGYYWLSDSPKPKVFDRETVDLSSFETEGNPSNPFVIESNLFCSESKISISVRHIDGAYMIFRIDWATGDECEVSEENYLGHSSFKDKTLSFRQAWLPVKDSYCEGFKVLTPSAIGFTGFSRGDNNE